MTAKHRRRSGHAAVLIAALILAACGTLPEQRVVHEGFVPPGTPVDVKLDWAEPDPVAFYNSVQGGATSGLFNSLGGRGSGGYGAVLLVLLLPVALIADAGMAEANAIRERRARRIAESITGLPDRASFERLLAEALYSELGWQAAADQAPLALVVSPTLALSKDARAVLLDFQIVARPRTAEKCPPAGCRDAPALEAQVIFHSDALSPPVLDAATRARLVAFIDRIYDVEGLEGKERTWQAQQHATAMKNALDAQLSSDEVTLLLIDDWIANGGARLKQAFADSARNLATALRVMREHPGAPPRNKMGPTRVLFPEFYDGKMPVSDLDQMYADAAGRRVLRSRYEPIRSGGIYDEVANVWFSVPARASEEDSPEKTLIDFMYRLNEDRRQKGLEAR